jgi:proteasome lid subunit RPN8/RPN11
VERLEVSVDAEVIDRTLRYLEACLPEEGVGLWSGRDGVVQTFTPLPNCAPEPTRQYAVDPKRWVEAWMQTAARGETPLALVHSHPTASATPSRVDREEWQYPDLWCVIVSFADEEPSWQAFRIE